MITQVTQKGLRPKYDSIPNLLSDSTVQQKYNASHKCHLNFSCGHNTNSKKNAMNFNKLFYLIY